MQQHNRKGEIEMIELEYPKDIIFENRLCILLKRNKINFQWTNQGMAVDKNYLEKANNLIQYLKENNKPV